MTAVSTGPVPGQRTSTRTDRPEAHHDVELRQWSADVTLFGHNAPEPTDEEYEQLAARGIGVVDGEVAALEVTGDRLSGVRLAGGRVVPRQAVVVAPRFTARSAVLTSLGLAASKLRVGDVEREVSERVLGSRHGL